MVKKLEAVIFDLDGVIANTVELYFIAGKRLADELNVSYERQLNQRLQGLNRYKTVEIMLGSKLDLYTQEEIHEIGDRKSLYYRELLGSLSAKDLLPGMVEFLKELKTHDIKTGLASSSSNAHTVVEKLGIENYLDYIVDIKQIKHGKPSPEIFIAAAKGLSVDRRKCVAIEDGEAGLTGILKAEMFAVGVGAHKEMQRAHWQVDKTSEITYERLCEKWEEYQQGLD
ncbi:beta-phosphoglucomutase [Anaerobacillus alkaliphilus]|uniref:Beta-phosphoglucomutase n=1 Tax=Anaerobacillus alkaliphilus TaxID=1548597 RepID=A0A4Q0VWR4_9BACI|nr:beta-phosphoglucomutase [Anaerobacillus alkaliphilus]RXJ02769.1 beta-phosphoglucomutase [Anaerobacillus alkaliphilus]